MNQTPFYIVFASIAGLALYGALLLNINSKSQTWRRGIYVGMIGSAYTVAALCIPRLELFPCLVFMGTIAVMLTGVVSDYFFAPSAPDATPVQLEARTEVKHRALLQVGIGLALSVVVATCAGYTQGQSADNRVQIGFAQVVYRLADEVQSLHQAVNELRAEVGILKKGQQTATQERAKLINSSEELKKDLKQKRK